MALNVLGAAHVCGRCARQGPTCCQPAEGVALAPLTPGDIRRIQRATGLPASEFSTTRVVDADEVTAIEEQDPVLRGLARAGVLTSLAIRTGACVFWSARGGCTLDFRTRPLLCRRYPIVRQGRRLLARPGGDCLAIDESVDMVELMNVLGTSPEALAAIDRQIRRDLRPY